eukprot:scaffold3956_cov25-Cyclotella_meneghiniana.AAC.3
MNFIRSIVPSLLLSVGPIAADSSPSTLALIEKLSNQVDQLSRGNRELIARVEQLELRSDVNTTNQHHRMAKSSKAGGAVEELPSKYILDLVNAPNATESEQFLKELHCPTNGWPPIPQPIMLLVSLQGPKYWNVGSSKATACNGLVNIDACNGLSYLPFKNGYQADKRRLPMTSSPDYNYQRECAEECLGEPPSDTMNYMVIVWRRNIIVSDHGIVDGTGS